MKHKKLFVGIGVLALLALTAVAVWADPGWVTHTFGGSATKYFDIDDNGGDDAGFEIGFDSARQTYWSILAVFDGTNVDDGNDGDFTTVNAINLFDPPDPAIPDVDEITAHDDDPLVPTSFDGTNVRVEQVSYVQDASDFVLIEYTVVNTTTGALPVKIAMGNDWDLNNLTGTDFDDPAYGFDAGNNMVYQQDVTGTFSTTIGCALVHGTLDAWRVETYATGDNFVNGGDAADRKTLFDGTVTGDQVGALPEDLVSTVSADLGTLGAGESGTAAFCFVMALGADEAGSLANAQAQAEACAALYEQLTATPIGGHTEPVSLLSLLWPWLTLVAAVGLGTVGVAAALRKRTAVESLNR